MNGRHLLRQPDFSSEVQKAYREFYHQTDATRAAMVALSLCVPQVALVLNDRQLVASDVILSQLVALRIFALLIGVATAVYLVRNRDPQAYDRVVGGVSLFGVSALAFIASTRPPAPIGFFVSGVLLISVYYFVLPGRLWYRVLAAFAVTLILAQVPFESSTPWYLQNHLVPLGLFHVLALPVVLQEERFRRQRFLAHLGQDEARRETLQRKNALEMAKLELANLNAELESRLAEGLLELRRSNQSLAVANAELLRANRAKDGFLATVSHELRTPLNAMLTYSEALLEGVYDPLSARQRGPITTLRESGQHLSSMIDDLLDLASIEAGASTLALEAVRLEEVLQSAVRMVEAEVQGKEIHLDLHCVEDLGVIEADPRRLRQIVLNLLTNAAKFTPSGGSIDVRGERGPEGGVRISVRDTGIGIAAADLERIFEPFVQLDSGLARQHAGAGLGLLLVRDLTRLHGGRVGVESEVGKGSFFYVDLPRSPPGQATTRTADRLFPA